MVVTVSVLSIVIASLLIVLAVVWSTTGILGLTGRLQRNRWIGVRADETMRSAAGFTLANRVAGPGLLGASLILVLGAVLTVAISGWFSLLCAVVALTAALAVVGVVSGLGVRAAATIPAESADGGCGCCSGGDDHAHDAPAASTSGGTTSGGTTSGADAGCAAPHDDPAADCGTSSCGACSLRGMCTTETAQA
ncbi:SdpI family protein [Gordonia sp. ABSL1-1]|uniref:SdpI family protein n=1 Tax=Gordonia sp. ABSL1-1 TaxID=3053923 RepID=UPI002573AEE6|nr:SdpI family protein [Gordonia sp. ABSL1-1]MDL9936582.1 SdpI family protein [Gordonia sp. ABSL1-1]